MAFNASVNLGTVGNGITGQTVSISGCTGTSCESGCTPLVSTQAVTSFPKTITGIPDGTVSLFVMVDTGDCTGTSQCITITGIPNITPSPTITPTLEITPTTTITPTLEITPTTTITPTLEITPTTTITETPITGCVEILYEPVLRDDLGCGLNNIYREYTLTYKVGGIQTNAPTDITYTVVTTPGSNSYDIIIPAGQSTITDDSVLMRSWDDCVNRESTDYTIATTSLSGGYTECTVTPTTTTTPTIYAYCYEIEFPLSMVESDGQKLRIFYQKADYTNVEYNYDLFPDSGANAPNYTINICSRVQPSFRYGLLGDYFIPDAELVVTQGSICNSTSECGGIDPIEITSTPTITSSESGGCTGYDLQSDIGMASIEWFDCGGAYQTYTFSGQFSICTDGSGYTVTQGSVNVVSGPIGCAT